MTEIGQKINKTPTKDEALENKSQKSSSGEQVDFDPDSPNQKFFNLKDVKPLDLKTQWLGSSNDALSRFDKKMEELKEEKNIMKEGFKKFAENQRRFKLSSLRKINFDFDKKALYLQFMEKSRKKIEKLHPSLIINIYSYIEANVFLAMIKMRRVSKIFDFIYRNEQVATFFSVKDFGVPNLPISAQHKWCKRNTAFCQTLLYYKAINYTILIPQNSIKEDLEKANSHINDVYKKVYEVKSTEIGYFQMLNTFMRTHRVPIALQSLAFSDIVVTRQAAIIAFCNYLAFNPSSRLKEEITKTKYLKMIEVMEGEDCRDALVVNSKISNFLIEDYGYEFATFVDTLKSPGVDLADEPIFDLVVFHNFNSLRSFFARGIVLESGRIEVSGVSLEFTENLKGCNLGYSIGERWQSEYLTYHYMPTVGQNAKFGHCYIYRGEFFYILIIKTEPLPQESIE